jgi:putative heme-binding domain-containing protein
LWHHQVKPKGATFEETRKPEPFIKMTRPTDADVDGMSRVYCASWKGATFGWAGPDVGYIVQVKPKGFKAEPLPDFAKAKDAELVKYLDLTSPQSYRRRIEAQRELMRRGNKQSESYLAQYATLRNADRNLVASLKEKASNEEVIAATSHADPVISHTAIRATAARQLKQQALSSLDSTKGNPTAILRALAMMHQPEVVTGLIERLGKATDPALRNGILAALCRLHFQEGEWKGDSWGTRPDTRGPYYQPEAWSETPKIAAALKEALAKASPEEAAFLVKELNRNRIQFNEALVRILELAKKDEKVIPDAVAQLATADTIPADAVPLLVAAVQSAEKGGESVSPVTLSKAIIALTKTDSAEGVSATLAAFHFLKHAKDATKEFDDARTAFMNAPKLENHHQLIEDAAVKQLGKPVGIWADAALISLSTRKSGAPESRELSAKALDAGWQIPQRRIQIITGAGEVKSLAYADKIIAALDDPDKAVAAQAKIIAGRMKLEKKAKDTSPLIGSLKPEDALAAAIKTKGDVSIGEQIFTKATCIACHTTKESEAQKGPYLGNIAQTYKRPDLAQNILDPNKTIAQGFASEVITLNDGTQQMGFITLESADSVKLRNVAAQEFTFAVKDIKSRQKLPISIMPPGLMTNYTVREFASLLDYLESLAKK